MINIDAVFQTVRAPAGLCEDGEAARARALQSRQTNVGANELAGCGQRHACLCLTSSCGLLVRDQVEMLEKIS